METVPASDGPITGSVLFYSKPEPLSVETHAHLGITPSDKPFRFVEAAQAIPLHVTEFGLAARLYPIIFAGDDRMPMAVMGIRANENLFVKDGLMEPDSYIPTFIRRYPFVLATNPSQPRSSDAPQMIVCIDAAAEALVDGGDVPLFEDGKLSAFSQQMIEFCGKFEAERHLTELFVNRLKQLDLLETKNVTFTPNDENGQPGEPVMLADFFAISEEKLAALPPEVVAELHASGALRQIYAHLESAQNWERLVARSVISSHVAGNA